MVRTQSSVRAGAPGCPRLARTRPVTSQGLVHHRVRVVKLRLRDQAALWATAFYAGLRRGELRAIRWTDVDLGGAVLHVRRSWDNIEGEQTPKSMSGIRDVLILPQLGRELGRHGLDSGRAGDDLVFGRSAREPFALMSVARHARDTWEAAKMTPVTLHAMPDRHKRDAERVAAWLAQG